jgi:hypothetical protein
MCKKEFLIEKVCYDKKYSSISIIFMSSVTKLRTRCRNTSQRKNTYVTKLRHHCPYAEIQLWA